MRFFELHFNPRQDAVFDTFCYEPQNFYERKAGYLFIAAELKNALPPIVTLLDKLATQLKTRYYQQANSPEAAMKIALRGANEFLQELAKQGEVSWLGNLSAGICGISERKRGKFLANFTKVGTIKILLIRPGQIVDVGKNLEFSEIEPYPLKIFSNVVSGDLAEYDIVAVLTQPVFACFTQTGLLKEIAQITSQWDEKKFRAILKSKDKDFKNLSGVCLFCVLTKNEWSRSKEPRVSLTFQREAEKFSLKKMFLGALSRVLKKIGLVLSSAKHKPRKQKRGGSLNKLRQKLAALLLQLALARVIWRHKNAILVLLLILALLLGFLLFR